MSAEVNVVKGHVKRLAANFLLHILACMRRMSNVSLLVGLDFVRMERVLGLRNVEMGVVLGGLFRLTCELRVGSRGCDCWIVLEV